MQPAEFPSGGRGVGRTQWMIDRLLDCIAEGQPKNIVVANNHHSIDWIRRRVIDTLVKRGIQFSHKPNRALDVCGSEIRFTSVGEVEHRPVSEAYGQFWDHYACGIE